MQTDREVVRKVEVRPGWAHDALSALHTPVYLWPWEFAPACFKEVASTPGEWLVLVRNHHDRPDWTKPGSKLNVVENIEVKAPSSMGFAFSFRVLVAFENR